MPLLLPLIALCCHCFQIHDATSCRHDAADVIFDYAAFFLMPPLFLVQPARKRAIVIFHIHAIHFTFTPMLRHTTLRCLLPWLLRRQLILMLPVPLDFLHYYAMTYAITLMLPCYAMPLMLTLRELLDTRSCHTLMAPIRHAATMPPFCHALIQRYYFSITPSMMMPLPLRYAHVFRCRLMARSVSLRRDAKMPATTSLMICRCCYATRCRAVRALYAAITLYAATPPCYAMS